VLGAAAAYVGFRILNPLHADLAWRVPAWILLLLPVPLLPSLLVLNGVGAGKGVERVLVFAYVVLGLFSFLFVFALARDLVWAFLGGMDLLSGLLGQEGRPLWPFILPETGIGRQHGLRGSSIFVMVLSLFLLVIGMLQALGPPKMKAVAIHLDRLHPDLEGFRIAQLSDIHLGPLKNGRSLARVVHRVNQLSPDLVAITGDLVDGPVKKLGKDAEVLAGLFSPTFFVNGNHETYWDPRAWTAHLNALGITVLLKEPREVRKGGATLQIMGDYGLGAKGRQGRSGAASSVRPTHSPGADFRLLLAHQPGAAFRAEGMGFDLQLSGHTHGGQFFPWNLVIDRFQPFAKGLHRHQGMWVYTSRGTGFWGPPVRLGAPPEITLLTLKRKA
jgi:predicted MPP superfamily phosphohydrolase